MKLVWVIVGVIVVALPAFPQTSGGLSESSSGSRVATATATASVTSTSESGSSSSSSTGIFFPKACSGHLAQLLGGGWKSMSAAPREGSVVELANTYGVAPTYGIYRWTSRVTTVEPSTGQVVQDVYPHALWVGVGPSNGTFIDTDKCMYWRSYAGSPAKYVDPTHGAQRTTAYWCRAMHIRYNKAKDKCEY